MPGRRGRRPWRSLFAGILVLGLACGLAACGGSSEGENPAVVIETAPQTAISVEPPIPAAEAGAATARGQTIFATTCALCHGAAGQGQPNWRVAKEDGTLPPPPLNGDGHAWHHADGLLYRIVRQGGAVPSLPNFRSGMPAFGEQLSHHEIIAVLTYIKSLWGDKTDQGVSIREWQAQLSRDDPFPPEGR